jgi:hypothetical protein
MHQLLGNAHYKLIGMGMGMGGRGPRGTKGMKAIGLGLGLGSLKGLQGLVGCPGLHSFRMRRPLLVRLKPASANTLANSDEKPSSVSSRVMVPTEKAGHPCPCSQLRVTHAICMHAVAREPYRVEGVF